MEQGVIQWYNHDKGYGYIKEGEAEYFVHYSAIKNEDLNQIKKGVEVSFKVNDNRRLVQASHVSIYRPDEEGTDEDTTDDEDATADGASSQEAPESVEPNPQTNDEASDDKSSDSEASDNKEE